MEFLQERKSQENTTKISKPLLNLNPYNNFEGSFNNLSPSQLNTLKKSKIHDDLPVKKSQKTFEELLEEELQRNNELADQKIRKLQKTNPKFLKRGQGALCTSSRASTPSTTRYFTPIQTGVISSVNGGFGTPSEKLRKTTSVLNVRKIKPNALENLPTQEIPEKFVIKPLDLYKIRRQKWKAKEENLNSDATLPENLLKVLENEKKNTTERNINKDDEVNSLKMTIKQLKDNAKNRENYFKKELETYQNQVNDLKKQNIKLMLENNNLKQKIEKFSLKTNSGNSAVFSTRIHRKKSPVSDIKNLKNNEAYKTDKKETFYPNGAKRETYSNGITILYYTNKDIKQEYPDGKQIYYFAEPQTTQITYPNGKKELKFKNGQEEIYFPDSSKEIHFTDGTIKYFFPNGDEQIVFKDGTIQKNVISTKNIKIV